MAMKCEVCGQKQPQKMYSDTLCLECFVPTVEDLRAYSDDYVHERADDYSEGVDRDE